MDYQGIVVDIGSSNITIGFAGDDEPRKEIPSLITSMQNSERSYGENALDQIEEMDNNIKISTPFERDRIKSEDDFEKLMKHSYDSINVKKNMVGNQPVLYADHPGFEKKVRSFISEISFEKMNMPAIYFNIGGILAIYASGRSAGIDIDIGHSITHIIPVYEGYMYEKGVLRQDFGGKDIEDCLEKMLNEKGYYFNSDLDRYQLKEIKESLCYFSDNYEKEKQLTSIEKEFKMPDGNVIKIDKESFKCTESLFKPKEIAQREDILGLHEMIFQAIQNCNIYSRKTFYCNVIISGGGSLFEGIKKKFSNELKKLIPKDARSNVVAPQERKLSTWIGGSILASLSTFQNMWITKDEFLDVGSSIVLRKCLNI